MGFVDNVLQIWNGFINGYNKLLDGIGQTPAGRSFLRAIRISIYTVIAAFITYYLQQPNLAVPLMIILTTLDKYIRDKIEESQTNPIAKSS